jgi:transcription elongation factor Elf1
MKQYPKRWRCPACNKVFMWGSDALKRIQVEVHLLTNCEAYQPTEAQRDLRAHLA